MKVAFQIKWNGKRAALIAYLGFQAAYEFKGRTINRATSNGNRITYFEIRTFVILVVILGGVGFKTSGISKLEAQPIEKGVVVNRSEGGDVRSVFLLTSQSGVRRVSRIVTYPLGKPAISVTNGVRIGQLAV